MALAASYSEAGGATEHVVRALTAVTNNASTTINLCGRVGGPGPSIGRTTDKDIGPLCAALTLIKSSSSGGGGGGDTDVVTDLDLSYNPITTAGAAEALGSLLAKNKSLVTLDLSYTDLDEEAAKHLSSGLLVNSSLRTLRLRGCKIGDGGNLSLAGALQVNTTLENLDVGETDAAIGSLIAYCTVLHQNTTLRSLNLDRPVQRFDAGGAAVHICEALANNDSLEELSVARHGIDDAGCVAICSGLERNTALKALHLNANGITRDGAVALARMCAINSTLRTLNLSRNRLEDEGVETLCHALAHAGSRKETTAAAAVTASVMSDLRLDHNNIELPRGIIAIAAACAACDCLKRISVWGNPAIAGVRQSAEAFACGCRGRTRV
eukprot:UC1_evm1s2060